MIVPIAWTAVGVGGALVVVAIRKRRARTAALVQLQVSPESQDEERTGDEPDARGEVRYESGFGWLPYATGLAGFALLRWLVELQVVFAASFASIIGIVTLLIVSYLRERSTALLERQLADAIDLLVASLRAGAGVLDSLDDAVRESNRPLRPILQSMLFRLRLGDSPKAVFADLAEDVPLESFRVFAMSQSVHWEVGGSLATSLANVGRFIRDRIDVSRSISIQTAQAKISVVAVAVAAYFIALVVWRARPEEMVGFLSTSLGRWLVSGALVLQALGLLWMFRLTRIRY